MAIHFTNDWESLLQGQFEKEYYQNLRKILIEEYKTHIVYPPMHDIYNAFHYTPLAETKVCILGQDPYHGEHQAHGLAFSVQKDVAIPPSLLNIYKELHTDLGFPIPDHGNLKKWADEGVLLLNAVLTVRAGQAASHRNIGWEEFTGQIIKTLNDQKQPIIFILWGRDAQNKKDLITNPLHHIITSPHPSPLSAHRGFFGSKPFSRANKLLSAAGRSPIDWEIR
ncbi:uracil-DNA glycosylase [Eubacteriaceae bacterium ES2]|nr:uracil-DNA glycosylase [Eubacteriaceae bacterium ES2]